MTTTTSNMPIASTSTTSINTTKIPASTTTISDYEDVIKNFETNINSAQQLYTTLKAENQRLSTTILDKIDVLNNKSDSSQISHLTQDAQMESTKINFLEKYLLSHFRKYLLKKRNLFLCLCPISLNCI